MQCHAAQIANVAGLVATSILIAGAVLGCKKGTEPLSPPPLNQTDCAANDATGEFHVVGLVFPGGAMVSVRHGFDSVEDAVVSVSGVSCEHTVAGIYWGDVPAEAGDEITLRVTSSEGSFIRSVTMPEAVTITSPAQGATFGPNDAIPVRWSQPASCDVAVGITFANGALDGLLESLTLEADAETSHTLPPQPWAPIFESRDITVAAVNGSGIFLPYENSNSVNWSGFHAMNPAQVTVSIVPDDEP